MSDDAPQAGPYRPHPRPHPRPHLSRTVVLLVLIGALLLAIAWIAHDLVQPGIVIPQDSIVRPWDGGYDPGLYTPFTRAPEQSR